MNRDRFEPTVVCLSTAGPYKEPLEAAGIKVDVAGFRGFRVTTHPRQVAVELVRLFRLIRRTRPDIVHGFLFWAYILGAYVAWLARVPVFISSRRGLGHFKARRDYRAMEWVANLGTRMIVANSEAVRQNSIQQERLEADRTRVIYNGLDLDRFDSAQTASLRESFHVPKGAPVVAVVSNFNHYKGHATFITAWAKVVRRHPDAVALLVGDGPTRDAYEAETASMGLTRSVAFSWHSG